MSKLQGFDPNALPDKIRPTWATYIPRRSPAFKTHTQRSHALSAVMQRRHSDSIIYERVGEEWVERVRHMPSEGIPADCEMCQQPLERHRGRYEFVKSGGVAVLASPMWLCFHCRRLYA